MTLNTKTIKIPSIIINKDLLQKIGKVFEEEVNERMNAFEKEKQEKINTGNLKDWEIESLDYKKPSISIQFTIHSSEEELSFGSMKELLETSFFPEKIDSFTARVGHTDKKYVDIHLSISKATQIWFFGSGSYCRLSSENQERFLIKENQLKNLFRISSTSYSKILYPFKNSDFIFIIPFVLSVILAILFTVTFVKFPYGNQSIRLSISLVVFAFWYQVFIWYITKAYPYYQIKIEENNNSFFQIIKFIINIAILAVFSGFVYDLFKIIYN